MTNVMGQISSEFEKMDLTIYKTKFSNVIYNKKSQRYIEYHMSGITNCIQPDIIYVDMEKKIENSKNFTLYLSLQFHKNRSSTQVISRF